MSESQLSKTFASMPLNGAREVVRQGELLLDGMVQTAIAADQRATSLASTYGSASGALFAAAVAAIAADQFQLGVAIAGFWSAFWLFIAAVICGYHSRPIPFNLKGYEPGLIADLADDEQLVLRHTAADLQRRINDNKNLMGSSARWIRGAMMLAAFSILSGVIVFFTWSFLFDR